MKKMYTFAFITCMMLTTISCKTNNQKANTGEKEEIAVDVPAFNADSAYQYIQAQVDFGPRIPNTKEHVACGEYLAAKLESFGAKVTDQYADLMAFDGTILKARNIIGSYKPESKKRILLFAHWDSRPWSDSDPDPKNHRKPVMGANDGASGVGVLLEIARQIQKEAPALGVDIIFFDAEDYGVPEFLKPNRKGDDSRYWCLGSQYWARYPHVQGYNARFGILLDMVGGKGAVFYREGYSEEYASHINRKVWKKARDMGFGATFVNEKTGYVTDDHVPVNQIARIPSIDIIPTPKDENVSFFHAWHTVSDTMENIDKSTLHAVGQTVMGVIYNEK